MGHIILHIAAEYHQLELAKHLIDKGADKEIETKLVTKPGRYS